MKIVFYISDHGFGHITRNLQVAKELLDRDHEVVFVTGQKQCLIVSDYLDKEVQTVVCNTDAGLVVQPGGISLDVLATIEKVCSDVSSWDERIAECIDADVYVVDIVPWALLGARKKGIISILMVSFTWIEQYESFLPYELLGFYKNAFSLADRVFYYELANPSCRKFLGNGIEVGFAARAINRDEVARIRSRFARPVVFISLGMSNNGLAQEFSVDALPYDFIVTSSVNLKGSNVVKLSPDIANTQDYVAASDFGICKAGWSTVAEMLIAGVPFAALNRPDVAEDTMTISILEQRGCALGVEVEELNHIEQIIERLKKLRSVKKYKNNSRIIADLIVGSK